MLMTRIPPWHNLSDISNGQLLRFLLFRARDHLTEGYPISLHLDSAGRQSVDGLGIDSKRLQQRHDYSVDRFPEFRVPLSDHHREGGLQEMVAFLVSRNGRRILSLAFAERNHNLLHYQDDAMGTAIAKFRRGPHRSAS